MFCLNLQPPAAAAAAAALPVKHAAKTQNADVRRQLFLSYLCEALLEPAAAVSNSGIQTRQANTK
jgi:hypothetical protein